MSEGNGRPPRSVVQQIPVSGQYSNGPNNSVAMPVGMQHPMGPPPIPIPRQQLSSEGVEGAQMNGGRSSVPLGVSPSNGNLVVANSSWDHNQNHVLVQDHYQHQQGNGMPNGGMQWIYGAPPPSLTHDPYSVPVVAVPNHQQYFLPQQGSGMAEPAAYGVSPPVAVPVPMQDRSSEIIYSGSQLISGRPHNQFATYEYTNQNDVGFYQNQQYQPPHPIQQVHSGPTEHGGCTYYNSYNPPFQGHQRSFSPALRSAPFYNNQGQDGRRVPLRRPSQRYFGRHSGPFPPMDGSHHWAKFCTYCRSQNKSQEECNSHVVRNGEGVTMCPLLRQERCSNCGATGDRAHTRSHCPGLGSLGDKQAKNTFVMRITDTDYHTARHRVVQVDQGSQTEEQVDERMDVEEEKKSEVKSEGAE